MSAPVRRARANSIGGSTYEGQNSGDVHRTDFTTGKQSVIKGGSMHWAVDKGAHFGAPAALDLHNQNVAFNKGEKGPNGEKHAPMGCVEARIESAIAAHHMNKGMKAENAWNRSSQTNVGNVVNQRGNHIPACGWCGRRGHH